MKLVGGYLHSKNVTQYEALCWNSPRWHLLFLPPPTAIYTFCSPREEYLQLLSPRCWTVSLPALQTPATEGTAQHRWERQKHHELSLAAPAVTEPVLPGGEGPRQEAGEQSTAREGSFSGEKCPHLRICFSEQTWLPLTVECCCFVRARPGHSAKRLTPPHSHPASPPPCLFWPAFQTFSRFLSLTQAGFSVSERGTSPWEQLLENKPPDKANLYKQVKGCLNYYKYYPGYNRAEFICPFVTMKQTPRNASQELLSLLKPLFLQSPGQAVDSDSQKVLENFPLAGRILFSSPKDSPTQGQPNPETLKKESGFVRKQPLNHIPLSKDVEVRVARVCLLQMMPLTSHCKYKMTLLSHLATW